MCLIPSGAPTPPETQDARALDLYARGRERLALDWEAGPEEATRLLGEAAVLAPEDARIYAAFAMALSRQAWWASAAADPALESARVAADRALELAPELGDAWLAAGLVQRAEGAAPAAATSLVRAVKLAPALSGAHEALGSLLLEAGRIDAAVKHLDLAMADPAAPAARWELARAHEYAGRFERADALIRGAPEDKANALHRAIHQVRFRHWRTLAPRAVPAGFVAVHRSEADLLPAMARVYASGRITAGDRAILHASTEVPSPRLRAARCQYVAELLSTFEGGEAALPYVQKAVEAGLQDVLWMRKCPPLKAARARKEWAPLLATVEARSAEVLAAIDASEG